MERRARESPLFRLVEQHLEELLRVWPARFARQHGPLRPVVERVPRGFTLVIQQSMLGGEEGFRREDIFADPVFAALPAELQTEWRELPSLPPVLSVLFRGYPAFTRRVLAALHDEGVLVMAGTDAGGVPLGLPGTALHQELTLLRSCGLTNQEVLWTATVGPARFLDREAEAGTVTAGKRADLILVDGDPLRDLACLRRPVAPFLLVSVEREAGARLVARRPVVPPPGGRQAIERGQAMGGGPSGPRRPRRSGSGPGGTGLVGAARAPVRRSAFRPRSGRGDVFDEKGHLLPLSVRGGGGGLPGPGRPRPRAPGRGVDPKEDPGARNGRLVCQRTRSFSSPLPGRSNGPGVGRARSRGLPKKSRSTVTGEPSAFS